VQNGIIRAIGPQAATRRGMPIVDGSRSTLLPGLIDAHVHSRTVDDLQQALRMGVTTVLDMAFMDVGQLRALRDAAASRMDVADFRSAGILATSPKGHGTQFGIPIPTIASADTADAFIVERKREGSDYLKIVLNGVRTATTGASNLDEASVVALGRAAHSRSMLVVAHTETIADARLAVNSGVDGLAHVWREAGPAVDVVAQIARRGTFVVPTIVTFDAFVSGSGAALVADLRLAPFMSAAVKDRLLRPPTPRLPVDVEVKLAAVSALRMAGAKLVAGTDSGSLTPTVQGFSLHRELELLVKAGLSQTEALTAATAAAADAFRPADRGRIVVGRRADLVMV
jgi:imidazolonepropionase-like amidohydrolase